MIGLVDRCNSFLLHKICLPRIILGVSCKIMYTVGVCFVFQYTRCIICRMWQDISETLFRKLELCPGCVCMLYCQCVLNATTFIR